MTHWNARTSSYAQRSHAIELQCISLHAFLHKYDVSVCIYNDSNVSPYLVMITFCETLLPLVTANWPRSASDALDFEESHT